MKEIQAESYSQTVRAESRIEYFQVVEGHYAVRVTGTSVTEDETPLGGRTHRQALATRQSVVDDGGLLSLRQYNQMRLPDSGVRLVSDETLQDIRLFGVNRAAWRSGGLQRDRDALSNPDTSELFEDLRTGKRTGDHLVRVYCSVAYGWDGYPIAQGFELGGAPGYGSFSDAHYDMEAVMAHLLMRDDIVMISQATHQPWKAGDEGSASLIWQAPVEFLREVYDALGGPRMQFKGEMWEAAFDRDVFGLRAAGIAKHDSYNPELSGYLQPGR